MKRLAAVLVLMTVLAGLGWAQQTEESYENRTEQELYELETLLILGREGLPLFRRFVRLQDDLLREVPGQDGQVYDFSNGSAGWRNFSYEVQARVDGARQGNEDDILWLEQFLLPLAEEALESGVIRDLLELRDLVEQRARY